MEKRVRKKSKRLSESSGLYEEDELPRKKAKRTRATTLHDETPPKPNNKSLQGNGSKKFIVSVDFTNNDDLKLGGVLLSQLNQPPQRNKTRRTRRSVSIASSHSNSIPEEIVSVKPEKMKFKNPKFCVSKIIIMVSLIYVLCNFSAAVHVPCWKQEEKLEEL